MDAGRMAEKLLKKEETGGAVAIGLKQFYGAGGKNGQRHGHGRDRRTGAAIPRETGGGCGKRREGGKGRRLYQVGRGGKKKGKKTERKLIEGKSEIKTSRHLKTPLNRLKDQKVTRNNHVRKTITARRGSRSGGSVKQRDRM